MSRPLVAVIGVPGVAVVAAGITAAVIFTGHGGPSSDVKGEKFVASSQGTAGGSSSGSASAAKPTSPPNASPPSKNFTITGSVGTLAPGVASQLSMRLHNNNNQEIRVQQLSVTASGGTTDCPNSMLLLGPGLTPATGQMSLDLLLDAKSSTTAATDPQFPVKLSSAASNACQDFMWTLTYSGSAVQG